MSDGGMNPNGAVVALEQATAALRDAVDKERGLPADERSLQRWNDEIHELRTLLATTALMIRTVKLPELAGSVKWVESPAPDQDVKPDQRLLDADAVVQAAQDDLNRAVANLTIARRLVAILR